MRRGIIIAVTLGSATLLAFGGWSVERALAEQRALATLDAAAGAVNACDRARAAELARAAWHEAHDALLEASGELERQRARPLPLRRYGATLALLERAERAARAAETEAANSRTTAARSTPARIGVASSADAAAALARVRDAIALCDTRMTMMERCQRRPREFSRDLETTRGNLRGYARRTEELEKLLASDPLAVTPQAQTLEGQIGVLASDLETVLVRLKCS